MSDVTYYAYPITGGQILYKLTGVADTKTWDDTRNEWVDSENAFGRITGMADPGCEEISKEEAMAITDGVE